MSVRSTGLVLPTRRMKAPHNDRFDAAMRDEQQARNV
jgi:hypothetical protein